jgi:hypothetical protein
MLLLLIHRKCSHALNNRVFRFRFKGSFPQTKIVVFLYCDASCKDFVNNTNILLMYVHTHVWV